MGQFALNLKRIRKEKKMTQEDLAKSIGVSRSAIGMYESGAREPDYETLEALADVFNIRMDDLAGSATHSTTEETSDRTYDLDQLRERLHKSPGLRMLLSASRGCTEEDYAILAQMADRMNRE